MRKYVYVVWFLVWAFFAVCQSCKAATEFYIDVYWDGNVEMTITNNVTHDSWMYMLPQGKRSEVIFGPGAGVNHTINFRRVRVVLTGNGGTVVTNYTTGFAHGGINWGASYGYTLYTLYTGSLYWEAFTYEEPQVATTVPTEWQHASLYPWFLAGFGFGLTMLAFGWVKRMVSAAGWDREPEP